MLKTNKMKELYRPRRRNRTSSLSQNLNPTGFNWERKKGRERMNEWKQTKRENKREKKKKKKEEGRKEGMRQSRSYLKWVLLEGVCVTITCPPLRCSSGLDVEVTGTLRSLGPLNTSPWLHTYNQWQLPFGYRRSVNISPWLQTYTQ